MMARILIVDDTRISRELLRRELEAGGHEIIAEAVNGEEGFIMYQELMPDIVTMENVAQILSFKQKPVLQDFIQKLKK